MRSNRRTAAGPKGSALLFAALGDPTRLRLVSRLSEDGPSSIMQLTRGSHITRQAIAKHLRMMERAGLVYGTRRGRESLWQFDPRGIRQARHHLDRISRQWDQALARLRAFVEEG